MSGMIPILATSFAAVCIWLTVRVINRRERWAIWLAIIIVAIFFLCAVEMNIDYIATPNRFFPG